MATGQENTHDVQYKTCDHSCIVNAGLISERIRSLCSAVRNDVRSVGEGEGEGE